MKQIDHDQRELSRKALKIIAVLSTVVMISIMIPLSMTIRWGFNQLPDFMTFTFSGIMIGVCSGYYIGKWEALRSQRTPKDG